MSAESLLQDRYSTFTFEVQLSGFVCSISKSLRKKASSEVEASSDVELNNLTEQSKAYESCNALETH